MTAGAPWSVKGIDPKAREIAKDLARRSGMTLGEWLNRMIVEGDPLAGADYAPERALNAPDEPIVITHTYARTITIQRPPTSHPSPRPLDHLWWAAASLCCPLPVACAARLSQPSSRWPPRS